MKPNTRRRKTQQKRKKLDLSVDGKCCSFRTRKASLAFRLAELDWYEDRRKDLPLPPAFEYVSKKQRIREERRALKWNPFVLAVQEQAWIDSYERRFGQKLEQAYDNAMMSAFNIPTQRINVISSGERIISASLQQLIEGRWQDVRELPIKMGTTVEGEL